MIYNLIQSALSTVTNYHFDRINKRTQTVSFTHVHCLNSVITWQDWNRKWIVAKKNGTVFL